jgi:hypothetical protein
VSGLRYTGQDREANLFTGIEHGPFCPWLVSCVAEPGGKVGVPDDQRQDWRVQGGSSGRRDQRDRGSHNDLQLHLLDVIQDRTLADDRNTVQLIYRNIRDGRGGRWREYDQDLTNALIDKMGVQGKRREGPADPLKS